MRVIAIDPGSRMMGWSAFTLDERRDPVAVKSGVHDVAKLELFEVADLLDAQFRGADAVGVELPGAWLGGREKRINLASYSELYQMIGIVRLCAERSGARVVVLTDSAVKNATVGKRSATKYEVHQWLRAFGRYVVPQFRKTTCAQCRQHGADADHSPDAADAVAIAHVVVEELRGDLPQRSFKHVVR